MQNRDESRCPGISFRRRIILLLVAWGLAAAAVAALFPVLEAAPMFPFGLFLRIGLTLRDLSDGHSGPNVPMSAESLVAIGWLLYAALTGGALLTRRKIPYF